MRQVAEFLDAGGEFHVVDMDALNYGQIRDAVDLLRESATADYQDQRPPEQIDYYKGDTAERLLATQVATNNPFLWPKQSFYNRKLSLAILDGEPQVMIVGDDNVSGEHEGERGVNERNRKRFIGAHLLGYRRWVHHRIGQRAISPELYDFVDDRDYDPRELTIVDAVALFSLEQASNSREHVTAYPHLGEREWYATLESWGLRPYIDEETGDVVQANKYVFGAAPIAPEIQTPMQVAHVDMAKIKILEKTDAERIIDRARDHLEIMRA